MKIVSYNINGIRASVKLGLIDWLSSYDADVYCFQEVRASEDIVREIIEPKSQFSFFDTPSPLSNYVATYNCGEVAGYAGTLVLSKVKPDKVLYGMGDLWQDKEGRTTTIIIGNLAIVDAYIPNGNSRLDFKMQYLSALTKFIAKLRQDYKVIALGDFNIAHQEIDITHPKELSHRSVFLPEEREAMTKILDCGMTDSFRYLHEDLVKYSWRSYRSIMPDTLSKPSRNSWQFRIDYILVDNHCKKDIVEADILDLPYSDHLPVFVTLKD